MLYLYGDSFFLFEYLWGDRMCLFPKIQSHLSGFDWVNTDNFMYAFSSDFLCPAKIATPSSVRCLSDRLEVYIDASVFIFRYVGFVWLYFAVLSKIRKSKNVINIDCYTMHIFTNKLENLKVGWSVYIDNCNNIRTYYNNNISICWWLWKFSDLLQSNRKYDSLVMVKSQVLEWCYMQYILLHALILYSLWGVIGRKHYGLKVVFCLRHCTAFHYHHHTKLLMGIDQM